MAAVPWRWRDRADSRTGPGCPYRIVSARLVNAPGLAARPGRPDNGARTTTRGTHGRRPRPAGLLRPLPAVSAAGGRFVPARDPAPARLRAAVPADDRGRPG